jgi:hypothetical protein
VRHELPVPTPSISESANRFGAYALMALVSRVASRLIVSRGHGQRVLRLLRLLRLAVDRLRDLVGCEVGGCVQGLVGGWYRHEMRGFGAVLEQVLDPTCGEGHGSAPLRETEREEREKRERRERDPRRRTWIRSPERDRERKERDERAKRERPEEKDMDPLPCTINHVYP